MNATGQRAKEIFIALIGHVRPEQWDERLAQECGGNAPLRRSVEALLQAHQQPDAFLDQPAIVHDVHAT